MLRDQRGGEVNPYTLSDLDREAAEGRDFGDKWKSTCGCLSQAMLFDMEDEQDVSSDAAEG